MPPLERFPKSFFAPAGSDEARELIDRAHTDKDLTVLEVTAMQDYEAPADGDYDPRFLLFVHKDDVTRPVLEAFMDQKGFLDAEFGETLIMDN